MTSILRVRFIFVLLLVLAFPSAFAYAADYTVAPGDTLYQIGQRYNTTEEAIQAANNLEGDLIYPGQKLTADNPRPDLYRPARGQPVSHRSQV